MVHLNMQTNRADHIGQNVSGCFWYELDRNQSLRYSL